MLGVSSFYLLANDFVCDSDAISPLLQIKSASPTKCTRNQNWMSAKGSIEFDEYSLRLRLRVVHPRELAQFSNIPHNSISVFVKFLLYVIYGVVSSISDLSLFDYTLCIPRNIGTSPRIFHTHSITFKGKCGGKMKHEFDSFTVVYNSIAHKYSNSSTFHHTPFATLLFIF